jgi:class 3 adenylate cyclase
VYGEQEVRQPSGSTPKQPRLEGPCRPGLLAEPKDTSFSLRRCFRGGLNRSPKILVIDLSFDSLLEEVLTEGDDSDASACLVDGHGRYLAHTKPSFVSAGNESTDGDRLQEELFRAMKAQPAGRMLRGGPLPGIVLRYSHIPTTPWYLVFFSREEDILQPILAFRWNYLLAIVLLVIFTILLIRFNTRPVASSLAEIASAAQRVAKGNYDVSLHVVRSDEIGHLRMRFNQMVEGLRQRELMEQTFGRYVDRNVARRVIQRPEELHLGGEKHRVTILTSDLRGFTSMSEQLEPEDVVRFLNRYFSAMVQVVEKYGGVIVDFFGDSVLVFFDGMGDRVETRTLDAVKCAVEMQEEASRLTQENEDLGLPAIAMGIGIHTGPAVVGNIGSETRVRFGIVGSAVHETDQIQAIADKGTVIVSWETKSLVESELGSEIFREFSSNIDKSGKLYALDWTSADRLTADNQSSRPEPAADPE